ncbi:MAG: peptidase M20, partial [Chloroflexi bacterium]
MSTPIYDRPVDILRDLVRFDTTNPPGDEAACIGYVRDLLEGAGLATTILAKTPSRPNLIARLPGRGDAPPLLWQGHVDVVTTANQSWTHDPFGAELIDGMVWGRGTLDMKGGVAMMLAALLRAHTQGLRPAGDIILAVMADEEAASDYGARFLVEEHPEQFVGVRYAIGEGGGAAQTILGQRFYPIMVAEKQVC